MTKQPVASWILYKNTYKYLIIYVAYSFAWRDDEKRFISPFEFFMTILAYRLLHFTGSLFRFCTKIRIFFGSLTFSFHFHIMNLILRKYATCKLQDSAKPESINVTHKQRTV